jgi:signal transduction histidine kinase
MTDDEFAEYLAQIAHDLRTQLAAVRGFADLLIKGGDRLAEEKRDAYLERISTAGAKLDELIQGIEDQQIS